MVLLAAMAAANLVASVAASLSRIVWSSAEFGELLLQLVVIPVFLVWFYRARKNADGRGQDQRWGPGWAIGAWFVPVVWLWFPYQIMADIWRANLPAERRANAARLPGFWWGCWIAGDIFGAIALASARAAPGLHTITYVLAGLSAAAAAILLIVIVRVITRGPVGREPAAAQPSLAPQDGVPGPGLAPQDGVPGPGLAPQDGVPGPGLVYPQVPAYDDGGHLAAGIGYALSGLAVAIAAALTAAGIYGQSITTTPVAPHKSTAAPAPAPQELPAESLETGDCLRGSLGLNTNAPWPDLVMVVPCAEMHTAEVFYSANYWPQSKAFPGNRLINHQAINECDRAFIAYDGIQISSSIYSYDYIDPAGRQDWRSDDRQLMCVAYQPMAQGPGGEPSQGSLRGSYE